MAAEPEPELKLEIAHVLTIDVVAYSTLLMHEQSHVMAELNRAVRNTPCFRDAEKADRLTRLPTGDGMALVFFTDSEAPLECAMQISADLKSLPEIHLRMGIHSGPVNQIPDVNDRSNIAGAGIDMAQRVMDCGDAGHILVSQHVADDLAPYERWNRHLHNLGECEIKHGRRISIFNFYTDSFGNPEPPTKCRLARPEKRASSRKVAAMVTGLILLAAALLVGVLLLTRPKASEKSIAVLPFADLSATQDQEYFSDGLTEQIINTLGRSRDLSVVARTSALAFRRKEVDLREVGRILGVNHVLEGSVRRGQGTVRIDVRLINVTNGYQLWSETYDSTERDFLILQSDVALKVARALQVELQLADDVHLAKTSTQNPEAYDLYLRGQYLLNKRTADSMRQALALFQEAVAKDAKFALGRAGEANAHILLGKIGAMPGQEAAARAWPEVTSALTLDPELAEGYVSRGILLTDFEWNWAAAEVDFKKALALNPNGAAAHHWYARHLAQLGRFREAQYEIDAAQKLDPLAPMIRVTKAKIFFLARQYEQAIPPCEEALELEPNYATAFSILGQAYAHLGDGPKAIESAQKYVELSGGSGWARLELAYAYAITGDRGTSERIVQEVTAATPPEFSPYDMAAICSARGDVDGALRWIETAIEQRAVDVVDIRVDPRLDPVRTDPRFGPTVAHLVPRQPER